MATPVIEWWCTVSYDCPGFETLYRMHGKRLDSQIAVVFTDIPPVTELIAMSRAMEVVLSEPKNNKA